MGALHAQQLRDEETLFTVWLDFHRRAAEGWPRTGLPIWLESVSGTSKVVQGQPSATTFRIRLQDLRAVKRQMELRLFFDDDANAQPTVTGWTETGTQVFSHGPLGGGVGLPTSENLTFWTTDVDFVEITVAGDGHTVRGALLELLQPEEVQRALDFTLPANLIEAFERTAPLVPQSDDLALFGRVKASLDTGVTKLSVPDSPSGTWEFNLTSAPLLAILTFELLDPDAEAPLEVTVNDRPVGAISVSWPDLADPAYVGLVRPLEPGMRFHYSGWLRAQKIVPASALQTGTNRLILSLPSNSGSVAVRALELQLKYNWKNLDYTLAPTSP